VVAIGTFLFKQTVYPLIQEEKKKERVKEIKSVDFYLESILTKLW
jgi:hypothetical protein